MTEATIRIPFNINVKKISDEIIYKAFIIAIEQKKREINKELKRIDSKINRLEKKYKMSFSEFEQEMGDGFREHNDWLDWSYLVEHKNQLLDEIRDLEIA